MKHLRLWLLIYAVVAVVSFALGFTGGTVAEHVQDTHETARINERTLEILERLERGSDKTP